MSKSDSTIDDVGNTFEPNFGDQETAIKVLGLHKQYRKYNRSKIVLNGLNLNCQAGKLYILYGIGKSGKSAVVKSILQIESINRGAIAIFNKNVKYSYDAIGYMPQKVGLDNCLTAIETINYFAELQKLHRHECIKEFSAMQSPMTIGDYSILVRNLTEDQRKVISFYIAIMTSPKIVVLDQPVAGCDPLYKHFFWNKLRSMVDNEGTTVFMTCSDEIDIKYADVVGYLRNGEIITEEPPSNLMKRYNIWSFNDLILSLSVAELKQFQITEAEKTHTRENESIKSGGFAVTHFTSTDDLESVTNDKIMFNRSSFSDTDDKKNFCQSINMKDIVSQLGVLIKWQALISVRDYVKLLLHLILPILCVLFYGYSVGNDMTEVNLGIVYCGNDSYTEETRICDFEKRINKKYLTKKYYKTYDEAAKHIMTGDLSAILLLNQNPSNLLERNANLGCTASVFKTTNIVLEVGSSSKIVRSHIIDQLSRAYGGSDENPIIHSLSSDFDSATNNNHTCLTDCPITPFISTFHFHQVGAYDSEVMHLIWGVVATISHFSGAILGALPLCIQNRNGVLDRMKLMAITHYKLLIAHWATRIALVLVQNLLLIFIAIAFLRVDFSAYRFFNGLLAILLQTLCGFSFGILLFAILKKPVPILLSIIVLELIVSSLSGFFWNYHGLTHIFQKLTIILPHHAVSKLLYKVVIHNISVAHDNIWVGFVSPLFWMISTFVFYCVYAESRE